MTDGNGSATPRWRYSNEISLGQILQAITLITMIGGGAITSYVSLRNDIQTAASAASAAMATMNARISVLEARREIDDRFQTETRRDLGRMLDMMTEMRVQLGGKQDRQGALPTMRQSGSAAISTPVASERP